MIIKSFVFAGFISLLGQVIKDNTKFTSGHITSLFVVIGAVLGFLGIYEKFVNYFGAGASVVIMSFGASLYKGAIEYGILNMLRNVSIGIVASIVSAFIVTLIFKVRD